MLYFLTARAHVSETQVFEDFLVLLMPFILKRQEYYYTVEKDNTCDRHIHVLLEDNAKDMHAFINKFETKQFQLFWASLKYKLTNREIFLDVRYEHEKDYRVGYIFKDVNSRQGSSKFGDEKYFQDCVKLYWTTERLKAQREKNENHTDVTIMTGKNFYAKVQDFCNKTQTRYDDPNILYKMKKAGYGFINLSNKQKSEGLRELRIMKDQEEVSDLVKVKSEMYENSDEEKEALMEELLTLLFATESMDYNLQYLRNKYGMLMCKIDPNRRVG